MDPMMMSQGMFGGFNGGMGMNGMNMGMGFDGNYSGWGGNYAMGATGGMVNGAFGANAGYYPTGGYNQHTPSHRGHFNQMQNSQQIPQSMNNYQQNRFQGGQGVGYSRGYGRDRQMPYAQQNGGHVQNGANSTSHPGQQQLPTAAGGGASVQTDVASDEASSKVGGEIILGEKTEELNAVSNAENGAAEGDENETESGKANTEQGAAIAEDQKSEYDDLRPGGPSGMDDDGDDRHEVSKAADVDAEIKPALQPIAVLTTTNDNDMYEHPSFGHPATELQFPGTVIPLGPASHYAAPIQPDFHTRGRGGLRGFGRGGFRGRGGYGFHDVGPAPVPVPVEPKGQGVIGAPTGPKAMREGQPNVGFRGRGGAGFLVNGRGGKVGVVPNGPPSTVQER